MFKRIEYYTKYCPQIWSDVALGVLHKGTGIISVAGHTLYSDGEGHGYYNAFGTFPGCIRHCTLTDDLSDTVAVTRWHLLTPTDLICTTGYRPQEFSLIPDNFSKMKDCPDWSKLNEVFVEVMAGVDVANPYDNAAVWRTYFGREV